MSFDIIHTVAFGNHTLPLNFKFWFWMNSMCVYMNSSLKDEHAKILWKEEWFVNLFFGGSFPFIFLTNVFVFYYHGYFRPRETIVNELTEDVKIILKLG